MFNCVIPKDSANPSNLLKVIGRHNLSAGLLFTSLLRQAKALQEEVRLKSLNFTEGCFKFETLTMEGGRFVCIRENEGSELSVAIIDMHNNNSVIRKPIRAESAIMNPSDVIIALKAQMNSSYFIQVFHLETKEKLGNYQFDENIIFWRWISKNELALVTDNSVYHWAVGKGDPRVVFERSGKISDPSTKLVGYSVDKDVKWCLIYGIYSMDQGATVDGAIQLYSTERRQQQLFEGYAGTFGEVRISMDSLDKTRLLVFCEHKRGVNRTKLHIMDVYTQKEEGSPSPLKVSADVEKSADAPNDFPISIHILDSIGLVCILTKNGFAHFHHVATAKYLFTQRVSDVPVFVSSDKKVGGCTVGVLVVNKSGKVIEVTIDEDNLLESVQHLDDVAIGLATCYGLKGSEKHLAQLFESYFKEKKYKQSALIAATCKSNDFRDARTIERFKNAPNLPGLFSL